MKKRRTAHLRHRIASRRRISVSTPALLPARESFRSSLAGGFLNLCVSMAWVFFFRPLLATLAISEPGWAHLKISNLLHPGAVRFQREANSWDVQQRT